MVDEDEDIDDQEQPQEDDEESEEKSELDVPAVRSTLFRHRGSCCCLILGFLHLSVVYIMVAQRSMPWLMMMTTMTMMMTMTTGKEIR